jgi:hypothetical protein
MVWADLGMDFIEGLPRVNGKTVLLTIVDRFSKAVHFIPLNHPYSATTVARVFFDTTVHLHGIPSSIISDRDPVFTSHFWRELFSLADVKLNLTSAFHPQSDGQTEATNKIIMYLRCLTDDCQREWLRWLSWAEFCYNSAYQSALRPSLFHIMFGRDPPSLRAYTPGEARLPAVQHQLAERDKFLMEIKDCLHQAQQHYKAVYDGKHREVSFQPRQWVWLRLMHRPLASLEVKGRSKLSPKFYRPFKVLERVNDVAYRLELPPELDCTMSSMSAF